VGVKAADYLNEVTKGSFTASYLNGKPAQSSIEGFLFPDTYDIPVGASAHDVVQMQLDTFTRKVAPLLATLPKGFTAYQVAIMASIVEREARFDPDRPLVAGVLYNRLAQGMLLQVDASVVYGLGKVGQNPSGDDLQQDTPYNTYLHMGLPPTPIANPGEAAIRAAVQPSATDFLFYVSDGCGHNHYSKTVAEHDQAVAMYVGKPCKA
jgi:UPF0755 protein